MASALGFSEDAEQISYSAKPVSRPVVKESPLKVPLQSDGEEAIVTVASSVPKDAVATEQESYNLNDPNDPANQKGFKIWFNGKVLYNFGAEEGGVFNSDTGTYEHVGQYQLKMNRTANGVYLTVKTAEGYSAPAVIADEILWEIKDSI